MVAGDQIGLVAGHGLRAQWIPICPFRTWGILHDLLCSQERGYGSTVDTSQAVIPPYGSIVRHTIKIVKQL